MTRPGSQLNYWIAEALSLSIADEYIKILIYVYVYVYVLRVGIYYIDKKDKPPKQSVSWVYEMERNPSERGYI